MADDLRDLHQQALDRFKLIADTETAQRQRELEDLNFELDQWPPDVKRSREGYPQTGQSPGQSPVPPRPMLSIYKLGQPIAQVENQMRAARLTTQFIPEGDGADQETAQAFEDIARGIQVQSNAQLARLWAFQRAIRCGRGFYRLLTKYVNDTSDDQEIVYARILNQFSVYFDVFAQMPDWSDAEYAFITEVMTPANFRRTYPDAQLSNFSDEQLTGVGDEHQGWTATDEDGDPTIRVAEYFFIEKTSQVLLVFQNGLTAPEADVPAEFRGQGRRRVKESTQVRYGKMNGIEFLTDPGFEEPIRDWPGRYIPIIPVTGREYNIDGRRSWRGIIADSADAQRSYNYMRTAQVEAIALAPKSPFLVYRSQIEGYEEFWNQANIRNFPYLPVNEGSLDGTGKPLPLPQRDTAEPAIQAITLAVAAANDDIFATSGQPPAALGMLDPHDRSGKAIRALQAQAELGSSGYLDNLASCSMVLEGKILKDLIPKIYTRPGRTVATHGADDAHSQVLLGQPFTVQNGRAQPAPMNAPGAKTINLQQGSYGVAVTISKQYQTRREEAAASMSDLAQTMPQAVPAFADLWVESMDFPEAHTIADRLKQMGPFKDQGNSNAPDPMQLQQTIGQQNQMIQMLSQELQKRTQQIETDWVKEQAETERTKMKIDSQERIAAMNAQAKIADTATKVNVELADTIVDQENQMVRQRLGEIHEVARTAQDQAHERVMALQQQAHEQDLAAMQPAEPAQQGP